MHPRFMRNALTRWILYAASFGLLWAGVALGVGLRSGFESALRSGVFVGIVFATLAVSRERGGLRRRPRRR